MTIPGSSWCRRTELLGRGWRWGCPTLRCRTTRESHLDLYADDQDAEIDRLITLGADRVDWDEYPADPDFVVLADTEGNRFCVIDTKK